MYSKLTLYIHYTLSQWSYMYYNTVPPFLLGDDLYSSMFTMTLYVLKYHPNSYLEMTSSSMFTTMILYVLQYHPTYLEMTPSYLFTMTLYVLQYHPNYYLEMTPRFLLTVTLYVLQYHLEMTPRNLFKMSLYMLQYHPSSYTWRWPLAPRPRTWLIWRMEQLPCPTTCLDAWPGCQHI